MSSGIYLIQNNINKKCYIGKSSNIEKRWKYHKENYNSVKEYNKPLYRAFRYYGLNNFSFIIIENIDNYNEDQVFVNDREKYWIKQYNSFKVGYNATIGGDGGVTVKNPRISYGKLTNEEVIYLRKRYQECKYPKSYIYECEFKNKISARGFQAIWLGENAKDIMPEVFTEENKNKQLQLNRAYEGILRRKITLKEKYEILNKIKIKPINQVWREEYQDKYKLSGFQSMLNKKSLDEILDLSGTLEPLEGDYN